MSEGLEPARVSQPSPAPPPGRRGGVLGCLGRLLSALLVVLITTSLVLLALGVISEYILGLSIDTPGKIRESHNTIATLQVQNSTLNLQISAMQTQVLDLERRASSDREDLDELRLDLAALSNLSQQLSESDVRSATVVAEARESRDVVALFATAEADRVALLSELKRRSDRIERFLQRLGDISSDAAADLDAASPLPTLPPLSPTMTPIDLPTLTIPESSPTPLDLPTLTLSEPPPPYFGADNADCHRNRYACQAPPDRNPVALSE